MKPATDLPAHIGPAKFSDCGGAYIAVRCPTDFEPLMQRAGGLWEPGSRRWLMRASPTRRSGGWAST